MNFVYPLLHVLLYLAMQLAPVGTNRITIDGPQLDVVLQRADGGWDFDKGKQRGFVSIRDGKLMMKFGDDRGEVPVAMLTELVAGAVGNDWDKRPKVTLEEEATLEKTADGFVLVHEAKSYRIRYAATEEDEGPMVNVLGAVRRPGRYPLVEGSTVSTVIEAAGGLAGGADEAKVRILRGKAGEKPEVLPAADDLQQGDTIHVPVREEPDDD